MEDAELVGVEDGGEGELELEFVDRSLAASAAGVRNVVTGASSTFCSTVTMVRGAIDLDASAGVGLEGAEAEGVEAAAFP